MIFFKYEKGYPTHRRADMKEKLSETWNLKNLKNTSNFKLKTRYMDGNE